MTITHKLWVFDLTSASHLTRNQIQTVPGALRYLNDAFMSQCEDVEVSATPKFTGVGSISPGVFDAVVFLVADLGQSIIARLGVKRQIDPKELGSTATPWPPSGGIAEVYWGRCMNDYEVAAAIFHEAAHLKSEQGVSMHNYYIKGIGGGGVGVLSKYGGSYKYSSSGDIDFYTTAIKKQIILRTMVPY